MTVEKLTEIENQWRPSPLSPFRDVILALCQSMRETIEDNRVENEALREALEKIEETFGRDCGFYIDIAAKVLGKRTG